MKNFQELYQAMRTTKNKLRWVLSKPHDHVEELKDGKRSGWHVVARAYQVVTNQGLTKTLDMQVVNHIVDFMQCSWLTLREKLVQNKF